MSRPAAVPNPSSGTSAPASARSIASSVPVSSSVPPKVAAQKRKSAIANFSSILHFWRSNDEKKGPNRTLNQNNKQPAATRTDQPAAASPAASPTVTRSSLVSPAVPLSPPSRAAPRLIPETADPTTPVAAAPVAASSARRLSAASVGADISSSRRPHSAAHFSRRTISSSSLLRSASSSRRPSLSLSHSQSQSQSQSTANPSNLCLFDGCVKQRRAGVYCRAHAVSQTDQSTSKRSASRSASRSDKPVVGRAVSALPASLGSAASRSPSHSTSQVHSYSRTHSRSASKVCTPKSRSVAAVDRSLLRRNSFSGFDRSLSLSLSQFNFQRPSSQQTDRKANKEKDKTRDKEQKDESARVRSANVSTTAGRGRSSGAISRPPKSHRILGLVSSVDELIDQAQAPAHAQSEVSSSVHSDSVTVVDPPSVSGSASGITRPPAAATVSQAVRIHAQSALTSRPTKAARIIGFTAVTGPAQRGPSSSFSSVDSSHRRSPSASNLPARPSMIDAPARAPALTAQSRPLSSAVQDHPEPDTSSHPISPAVLPSRIPKKAVKVLGIKLPNSAQDGGAQSPKSASIVERKSREQDAKSNARPDSLAESAPHSARPGSAGPGEGESEPGSAKKSKGSEVPSRFTTLRSFWNSFKSTNSKAGSNASSRAQSPTQHLELKAQSSSPAMQPRRLNEPPSPVPGPSLDLPSPPQPLLSAPVEPLPIAFASPSGSPKTPSLSHSSGLSNHSQPPPADDSDSVSAGLDPSNPFLSSLKQQDLSTFLSHPIGLQAFHSFLERELALENLNYFLDYSQWRSIPNGKLKFSTAKQLIDHYIRPQGLQAINLTGETRSKILQLVEQEEKRGHKLSIGGAEQLKSAQGADSVPLSPALSRYLESLNALLLDAQKEILSLMRGDSFRRFKSSPSYQHYLMLMFQWNEQRKALEEAIGSSAQEQKPDAANKANRRRGSLDASAIAAKDKENPRRGSLVKHQQQIAPRPLPRARSGSTADLRHLLSASLQPPQPSAPRLRRSHTASGISAPLKFIFQEKEAEIAEKKLAALTEAEEQSKSNSNPSERSVSRSSLSITRSRSKVPSALDASVLSDEKIRRFLSAVQNSAAEPSQSRYLHSRQSSAAAEESSASTSSPASVAVSPAHRYTASIGTQLDLLSRMNLQRIHRRQRPPGRIGGQPTDDNAASAAAIDDSVTNSADSSALSSPVSETVDFSSAFHIRRASLPAALQLSNTVPEAARRRARMSKSASVALSRRRRGSVLSVKERMRDQLAALAEDQEIQAETADAVEEKIQHQRSSRRRHSVDVAALDEASMQLLAVLPPSEDQELDIDIADDERQSSGSERPTGTGTGHSSPSLSLSLAPSPSHAASQRRRMSDLDSHLHESQVRHLASRILSLPFPLVAPNRRLIKFGVLSQIIQHRQITREKPIIAFLFNDLFLWTNTKYHFQGCVEFESFKLIRREGEQDSQWGTAIAQQAEMPAIPLALAAPRERYYEFTLESAFKSVTFRSEEAEKYEEWINEVENAKRKWRANRDQIQRWQKMQWQNAPPIKIKTGFGIRATAAAEGESQASEQKTGEIPAGDSQVHTETLAAEPVAPPASGESASGSAPEPNAPQHPVSPPAEFEASPTAPEPESAPASSLAASAVADT